MAVVKFIISLSLVTFTLVYLVDLPTRLTGQTALVNEYYYENLTGSFILDIVVVGAYMFLAKLVETRLNLDDEGSKIACVALVTGVLSTMFYFLFSNGWQKGTFFSRWFAAAGLLAVVYDMVLVTSVFTTMLLLDNVVSRRLG